MLQRLLFVASLGMIFCLGGCGKDKTQDQATTERKVVVQENDPQSNEKKIPFQKQKENEPVEIKLIETDLSAFGLRASMKIPEGASIQSNAYEGLDISRGNAFSLVINPKIFTTLAEEKNSRVTQRKGAKLLVDEPDALLIERPGVRHSSFDLILDRKVGNRPFRIQQEIGPDFTLAQMNHMLESARSLQQTEQMKQDEAKAEAFLQKLPSINEDRRSQPAQGRLYFKGPKITDEAIADAKYLMNIREIGIEDVPNLTVRGFSTLAMIPGVTIVTFGSGIGDDFLGILPKIKKLNSLALFHCPITLKGLDQIKSCSGIHQVDIAGHHFGDDMIQTILQLPNLGALNAGSTGVTDKGLVGISERKIGSLDLSNTMITDSGLQHLAGLRNLANLNLENTRISGSGFVYFRELKLGWVNLRGTDINDRAIERLRSLPIQNLQVSNTPIGDGSLGAIGMMPELQILDAQNTNISDKGLESLNKATKLTVLNLDGTRIKGDGLSHLTALLNLSQLSLQNTLLSNEHLSHLVKIPKINFLNLNQTPITDAGLAQLKDFKNGNLFLSSTNVTRKGVEQFQSAHPTIFVSHDYQFSKEAETKFPELPKSPEQLPPADLASLLKKLKRDPIIDDEAPNKPIIGLDLQNAKLTDRDLAQLRDTKTLKRLNLSGNPDLSDAGLIHLKELKELVELNLDETKINGSGFVYLKALGKLQQLVLPYRRFAPEHLDHLKALSQLERITQPVGLTEFEWTKLASHWPNIQKFVVRSNVEIEYIKKMVGLRELTLGEHTNNLTLQSLVDLKNLRFLRLFGKGITDSGITHLSELPELQYLEYGPIRITDLGIRSMKSLSKLVKLTVPQAQYITDVGASDLKDMGNLAELSLHGSSLTDRGLERLSEMKDLEVLDLLGATKITDMGLTHLQKLEELRSLNLSNTKITGKGLESLSEMPKLRQLLLTNTPVSDGMLGPLRKFRELQVLDLSDTPLSDNAIPHLKTIQTLVEVRLNGTKITPKAIKELQQAKPELVVVFDNQ